MASFPTEKGFPAWVLPIVILGVLAIAFLVWRGLSGGAGDAGPPRAVHPGMYDFRQEAQNGALGRRPAGAAGHTP